MAERRFKSRYGAKTDLAPAQYLAEGMCERQANNKKVTLPLKFWEKGPWKRQFFVQLRQANSLLKTYAVEAIIRALKTPEGKRTFSLSAPWLDPLIQQEQVKWEREQERLKAAKPAEPPPATPTGETPRPTFIEKQSPLSKLRGLE